MLRPATALLLLLLAAAAIGTQGGCGGAGEPAPSPVPDPPFGLPVGPDVRLDTDPEGAELSLFPVVCCDGDEVYAAWYDRRAGNLDVHFNRSEDGGRTWLPADVRLDSGPPGAAGSLIPDMACSGQALYVVWYDDRNGAPDVYFNRSLDGGRTWLPLDKRLDTDVAGAAQSREPRVACDGSRVYVVWFDDRGGSWDVYFNRSLDAGATWLPQDVRIDRDPGPDGRAELPRIACSGDAVHVTWRDDRQGGLAVYYTGSLDAGATWPGLDRRLDTVGPAGGSAGLPRIACAAARVYVAWPDRRDGGADVRCNVSSDAGLAWRADDLRLDTDAEGAADSVEPNLCAADQAVYVVWSDLRNGAADVYLNHSLDGGQTWRGDDLRIDDDLPGVSAAAEPRVACAAGGVFVVWRDDRNGRYDVFLRHSPDGGAHWSSPETRLDTDPPGAGHSLAPRLCCQPGRAHVVWYDQRDGPGDVYANRVDVPTGP